MSEIPNHRFEFIPCPVCDNDRPSLLLKVQYGDLKQKPSLDYSALGITGDTWLFVRKCDVCGFVFVNPRIKPEYQRLVYNECKKRMYEHKGELFSPGTGEYRIESRKRKLKYIGPLLEVMSCVNLEKENYILFDLGCGNGYSMSLAREFGLDAFGVDIDEKRLEVCENLGLKVADPDEFDKKFPDVKADIILCQSNIEHLVDLPGTMEYVRAKAKPGAVLYVNGLTPRIISKERRRGEYVKAHFVEHINFFPVPTLDRFMAKYSFWPLPFRHMSLIRTFRDAAKGLAGYLLASVFGHASKGGFFKRIYRFNG